MADNPMSDNGKWWIGNDEQDPLDIGTRPVCEEEIVG